MQAVFPGQPQADSNALDYGYHEGQLVIAYCSGSTIVILNDHSSVLQTIVEASTAPHGFHALKYQRASGQIAAISRERVYIYDLHEEIKGRLRWEKDVDFTVPGPSISSPRSPLTTLSWGSASTPEESELLIATTTHLALFNTRRLPGTTPPSSPAGIAHRRAATTPVWTRSTASPVSVASLSPSAELIATLAPYACLVKIWRRLSFESPQFDFAYLRHPGSVTHVEWRRDGARDEVHSAGHGEEEDEEWTYGSDDDVLFTVCVDGLLRVWKADHTHGVDILKLYATIDLVGGLQPRSPSAATGISTPRWVCVLDSVTVQRLARENASGLASGKASHEEEHFDEIVGRKPDVVFVMDDQGHMSAWGLENVGCKRRPSVPQLSASPVHINTLDKLGLGFKLGTKDQDNYALVRAVHLPSQSGHLAFLAHHYDGRISWTQSSLRAVFAPKITDRQEKQKTDLTGHSTPIKKVIRTASGKALISRTDENVGMIWKQTMDESLIRQSTVILKDHIHRVVLLRDGAFLACLHHDKIALWNTSHSTASHIASCNFDLSAKPLCLIVLPAVNPSSHLVHLAMICSDASGVSWELSLTPRHGLTNGCTSTDFNMKEFAKFKLEALDDMVYVLPVDPAGNPPVSSDFLDIFSRDVAMSYTSNGRVQTYTAGVDQRAGSVDFLTTAVVETGIKSPALGSATSIRRAALVDATRLTLTIWDTRGARLDYQEHFANQIRDLDWASTAAGQSVLAVGFSRSVSIYSQLRYDYVNDRPAWARVKTVDVPQYNPSPIGDSVWFGRGQLVIGAGHQLHIASSAVDLSKGIDPELASSIPHGKTTDLFDLVQRLNSPLPIFHPQFIAQCILAGKVDIVVRALIKLLEVLKFYTEGDELDSLLGFRVEEFTTVETDHEKHLGLLSTFTPSSAQDLNDLLMKKSVPQLTSAEQLSLVSVIDCVATLSSQSRSLDVNGYRFLLFWQMLLIQTHRRHSNESSVTWRETVFAYHSGSHDILRSLVLSHAPSQQLTWALAKQSKIFTWLTDRTALLELFEQLARQSYSLSDPRDPIDCSLFYLALRKKTILIGLWRMATWHREQNLTLKLLRNDFAEARWQTAAKKNAFALLGKRRFQYAAAFFLLADDLKSALNVITNQMDDVELAIAVGRVYGGDDCVEVKDLVRDQILAAAVEKGDRWMANWALWFLGDRGRAVRALVSPLTQVVQRTAADDLPPNLSDSSHSPQSKLSLRAMSFLNEDPALVALYEQLRARSLQTLRGALLVTGREEWAFLSRTAGLLARMGCDILALDLVKNWEFLQLDPRRPEDQAVADDDEAAEGEEGVADLPSSPGATRDLDPRRLLRRRSSLVVDDLADGTPAGGPLKAPRSLLDGFGDDSSRSLLDSYGPGGGSKVQPSAAPSLLDGFNEPPKEAKKGRDDVPTGKKDGTGESRKPTEYKEPSANSILDSFDF